MGKIAVIDLGTNTCNLLIAEYEHQGYQILFQGKEIVKMGRGGIHKNLILDDGIRRAASAILNHRQKIEQWKVDQVVVVATSAVRDASNRDVFCKTIHDETGMVLGVISGEREAELIFKGVLLAFDNDPGNSLIVDIGGGSNEFIICGGNEIEWKESFPLGLARIIEKFPISDPITKTEIESIHTYFDENMTSLWTAVSGRKLDRLIGCSGAFDTIVDLIDQTEPGTKNRKRQEIDLEDFKKVYELLIQSTVAERQLMKGLEQLRIEMIVPAVILIDLVIRKLDIQKMVQTDFALREGVLYEQVSC